MAGSQFQLPAHAPSLDALAALETQNRQQQAAMEEGKRATAIQLAITAAPATGHKYASDIVADAKLFLQFITAG